MHEIGSHEKSTDSHSPVEVQTAKAAPFKPGVQAEKPLKLSEWDKPPVESYKGKFVISIVEDESDEFEEQTTT